MNILFASILPPFSLNLWQDVQAILNYDFMRQALLAGTILSLVAGLIGYFVVLRHQVFAGEALSDVAFTGALGGAALGFNPLLSLLVTTIAVALAMGGFGERLRGRDVAVHFPGQWHWNRFLRGNGVVRKHPGHLNRPARHHRHHQHPGDTGAPDDRAPIALCLAGPGCSGGKRHSGASAWPGLHGAAGDYC